MLRSAIIAIELSSTPLQELPRCSLLASAQPDSLRNQRSHQQAPLRRSSPTPFNLSTKCGSGSATLACWVRWNSKVDSAGAYWQADRYFNGGGAFRHPDVPVAQTSDPMLFEHWRTGDFTYDIPLAPGPYELHLYFVASPQDDPKTSFFNVNVNSQPLLTVFNIGSDALGANIADERTFKDIYPDKDGFLHIRFFMDRGAISQCT